MDKIRLLLFIKAHPQFQIYRDTLFSHLLAIKTCYTHDRILKILEEHCEPLYLDYQLALMTYSEALKKVLSEIQTARKVITEKFIAGNSMAENSIAEKLTVKYVAYGEPEFPQQLYKMEDPPLVFSYLGELTCFQKNTLAIVGSREPYDDSLLWMELQLPRLFQKKNMTTISGGARGVDQKVHALSLRAGCPTVVVLPSGLGQIYPAVLEAWIAGIIAGGGCVISEYAFDQKMHKYLFHHRNRLIAALGNATLIVEARLKSGTLMTAHQAAQLGRDVFVVPGHPLVKNFSGSLSLLCEGAQTVRDAEEIFTYMMRHTVSKQQSFI